MSSKGLFSTAKQFNAVGVRNKSKFPKQFIEICKMDQMKLRTYLICELNKFYETVIADDGYVYAPGGAVVVTAHMDTVHSEPVKTFYGYYDKKKKQNIISSPQGIGGDDRCGVYMILDIIRKGYRPTVIFCEDEEIGGVGSNKFCNTPYINEIATKNFIIELDRANGDDLVYYDDDNQEFHSWCKGITGYYENFGSFSDISHICPRAGISGVNISCGYYNAHTLSEYVVLEEMEASIEAAIKLIEEGENVGSFEYKRYQYPYRKFDFNNDYYSMPADDSTMLAVYYYGEDKTEKEAVIAGEVESECWVQFFMDNPTVCFNDVYDYEVY